MQTEEINPNINLENTLPTFGEISSLPCKRILFIAKRTLANTLTTSAVKKAHFGISRISWKESKEQNKPFSNQLHWMIPSYGIKDGDFLLYYIDYAPSPNADKPNEQGDFFDENHEWSAKFLDRFGLENERIIIKIMKKSLKLDIERTTRFMQGFGIKNQEVLIKIALKCAQDRGHRTLNNIPNFGITDQTALVKIAKAYAEEGNNPVDLPLLGIKSQEDLIEVTKQFAAKDGWEVPGYIKTFGIKSEEPRIEIAQICAKDYGECVANNFQNFEINNYEAIVDIARVCMQSKGGHASAYIQLFGITDTTTLIELATLCAGAPQTVLPEFIKNFEIIDLKVRIELAKLCAISNGGATARHISNFEIQDKETLLEIAKLCAQAPETGAAEHIKNFNITNQETLAEIARLCAISNGYETAKHFKQFEIENKSILFEIIKLCIENSHDGLANLIERFDFMTMEIKTEVAKLSAKRHPSHTIIFLQKFNIEDEETRFEIAQLCIESRKESIERVGEFQIKNQERLKKLALFSTKIDGKATAIYIDRFRISSEVHKLEILKESLLQVDAEAAKKILASISRYSFEDKNIETQFKLFFFSHHAFFANQNGSPSWEEEGLKFIKQCKKIGKTEFINQLKQFIEKERLHAPTHLTSLLNQIEKYEMHTQDLFHAIVQKAQLLAAMYSYLNFSKTTPEEKAGVIHSGLMDHALSFWQPHLRWPIFQALLPLVVKRTFSDPLLQEIDQNITSHKINQTKTQSYVIELAKAFALEGVDQNIIKKFLDLAFGSAQNFKDGKSGETLIQLLLLIIRGPSSTVQMKQSVLEKIIVDAQEVREKDFRTKYPRVPAEEIKMKTFDKDSKRYLQAKANIAESRQAYDKKNSTEAQLLPGIHSLLILFKMKKPECIFEEGSLEEIVQRAFRAIVPIGEVSNFAEKFYKIFQLCRIPEAIFQYAASIASTYAKEATLSLGNYLTAVLNGTFKTDRYSTKESKHLHTIAKAYPEVYLEWQKSRSSTFKELGILADDPIHTVMNYETWLRQKIGDRHIPINECSLTNLRMFADSISDINSLLKIVESALRGVDPKWGLWNILRFEFLCLKLTVEADKALQRSYLLEMKNILNKSPFNRPEFFHDVAGLLEGPKKSPEGELAVYDSDDPEDLLLAGTEVVGSCQKVTGNSDLNRGLLGYLWNGWNRILKVSNKADGAIKARCMIHLLWDGNKPVLLRDRFYPDYIEGHQVAALNAMAQQIAKQLGVPLLCMGVGEEYGIPIRALGGPAPFEYSDAVGGVQNYGIYTIKNACYLR